MRNFKPNLLPLYFLLFVSLTGSLRADLVDDIVCGIVSCGHGACKVNLNSTWGYDCECKHGWKQYPTGMEPPTFPPCIVPNCTIDYECGFSAAPSSAPSSSSTWMPPVYIGLRPCANVFCGEGSCVETGDIGDEFQYRCDCRPGYSNFRNITTAACLKPCSVGGDCSNLAFDVPSPPSNNRQKNGSIRRRNISSAHLLLTILLFITIFLGHA